MSSDDDTNFMTPALHFNDDYEDYDINLPPTSGEEYLRRVQQEAKQCPDIVVSNISQSQFDGKQTVKYNCGSGCLPAPEGYSPSLAWQINQVANFSEVRLGLSKLKDVRKKSSPIALPKIDNETAWCTFCFGSKFQKQFIAKTKGPLAGNIETTTAEEKEGIQPLTSIVLTMSQTTIELLLDYHIRWFEVTGFSPQQGQWFYALLSCLEKPLTPEACSSIRNLARNCSYLRACLESKENNHLAHLNLLICLVACYFDQTDLADR